MSQFTASVLDKLKAAGTWMRENFVDDILENLVWIGTGFFLCGILWLLVG